LPELQASIPGKRRFLPELSRTLHLESGILDEYGLPFNDDGRAAFFGDFVLVVSVSRSFLSLNFQYSFAN